MATLVLCVGCPGPVAPPPQVATHLAGNVIDSGTGKPVSGMTVSFGDKSSLTDIQGRFSLELGASQGTLFAPFGVHGAGYQFLFVEEISLDASRDWNVIIPVRRCPSDYSEPVTVYGEIRSSSGAEIPDGSALSISLFSTTGGSCWYSGLTYNGQYSFSTSLDCADCLLQALVEPLAGEQFVVMARGVDLSGSTLVRQDLSAPLAGYIEVTATPDKAGNQVQCVFITDYGPVPAFFRSTTPTLTWSFSSGAVEAIPVFNPFAWSQAVWIQIEEDLGFSGLPQHIKEFLSASSAVGFSSSITLPSIDRSLGPIEGADPTSLEYSNGMLSLDAVAGARAYAFTLRAKSSDGDVLGVIWTLNSSVQLPGWVLKTLSGCVIHIQFEALDCDGLLFNPRFLWGALPSAQIALGRVRGEDSLHPYEKVVITAPAGSVVIGLE